METVTRQRVIDGNRVLDALEAADEAARREQDAKLKK
jgi:hypothetical protein